MDGSDVDPLGVARRGLPERLALPAAVTALTLAVFGPLLTSGTVLLLDYGDYPVGPHPTVSPSAWGLPPALTSRAPIETLLVGLFRALPWGPVRMLPLLLVPTLAGWGFARLFGKDSLRSVTATLLYVINPFLYERMLAGQVYLVLGYALLPLFVSVLKSAARSARAAAAGGLLLALLVALSPHFVFLGGVIALGFLVAHLVRRDGRALARLALLAIVTVGSSLYWVIPVAGSAAELQRVSSSDLAAFRTAADARFGLEINAAGLYGFWRQGWPLPKDGLPGWPLFLAVMLFVAGLGLRWCWRHRASRWLGISLAAVGLLGFVLALGAQGPLGGLFGWLFVHVPGFRIMREPAKFLALLALAYAFLYAIGARSLVDGAGTRASRVAVVALLVALPCVYTFRMAAGFDGYVRPSAYPASWAQADALMGPGEGAVLSLPWHQYLPFPWTQDRVVSNPMASFFRRPVIVGDDFELGQVQAQGSSVRSRYLQFLFANGQRIHDFGNLVSPLGVRYVLLAKVADWRAYLWLFQQEDLQLVKQWGDLALFENERPAPLSYETQAVLHVRDWGQLVGLAQRVPLIDYAIRVERAGPGPLTTPGRWPRAIPARLPATSVENPVFTRVQGPVPSGYLMFSAPYAAPWSDGSTAAFANMGVTNGFRTPGSSDAESIRFGSWPRVEAAYGLSAAVVLSVFLVLLLSRSRAARRSTSSK